MRASGILGGKNVRPTSEKGIDKTEEIKNVWPAARRIDLKKPPITKG